MLNGNIYELATKYTEGDKITITVKYTGEMGLTQRFDGYYLYLVKRDNEITENVPDPDTTTFIQFSPTEESNKQFSKTITIPIPDSDNNSITPEYKLVIGITFKEKEDINDSAKLRVLAKDDYFFSSTSDVHFTAKLILNGTENRDLITTEEGDSGIIDIGSNITKMDQVVVRITYDEHIKKFGNYIYFIWVVSGGVNIFIQPGMYGYGYRNYFPDSPEGKRPSPTEGTTPHAITFGMNTIAIDSNGTADIKMSEAYAKMRHWNGNQLPELETYNKRETYQLYIGCVYSTFVIDSISSNSILAQPVRMDDEEYNYPATKFFGGSGNYTAYLPSTAPEDTWYVPFVIYKKKENAETEYQLIPLDNITSYIQYIQLTPTIQIINYPSNASSIINELEQGFSLEILPPNEGSNIYWIKVTNPPLHTETETYNALYDYLYSDLSQNVFKINVKESHDYNADAVNPGWNVTNNTSQLSTRGYQGMQKVIGIKEVYPENSLIETGNGNKAEFCLEIVKGTQNGGYAPVAYQSLAGFDADFYVKDISTGDFTTHFGHYHFNEQTTGELQSISGNYEGPHNVNPILTSVVDLKISYEQAGTQSGLNQYNDVSLYVECPNSILSGYDDNTKDSSLRLVLSKNKVSDNAITPAGSTETARGSFGDTNYRVVLDMNKKKYDPYLYIHLQLHHYTEGHELVLAATNPLIWTVNLIENGYTITDIDNAKTKMHTICDNGEQIVRRYSSRPDNIWIYEGPGSMPPPIGEIYKYQDKYYLTLRVQIINGDYELAPDDNGDNHYMYYTNTNQFPSWAYSQNISDKYTKDNNPTMHCGNFGSNYFLARTKNLKYRDDIEHTIIAHGRSISLSENALHRYQNCLHLIDVDDSATFEYGFSVFVNEPVVSVSPANHQPSYTENYGGNCMFYIPTRFYGDSYKKWQRPNYNYINRYFSEEQRNNIAPGTTSEYHNYYYGRTIDVYSSLYEAKRPNIVSNPLFGGIKNYSKTTNEVDLIHVFPCKEQVVGSELMGKNALFQTTTID